MSTFEPPLPRAAGDELPDAELVAYDATKVALMIAVTITEDGSYDINVRSKLPKDAAAYILREILEATES